MKLNFKTISLLFVALCLLLLVFIVDATFYHVPSFIKMYNYERELALLIAFLCIYTFINNQFSNRVIEIRTLVFFLAGSIFAIFLGLVLPSLILRDSLTLWNNNPFLAEYPLTWNITSSSIAVFVTICSLIILAVIKRLTEYHPGRYQRLLFRLAQLMFVLIILIYNLSENRYEFKPLSRNLPLAAYYQWGLMGVTGFVFFLNTVKMRWIDYLDSKYKWIIFFGFLGGLPFTVYLFISKFITIIFAYSVSVKGFVLSMLGFINIFLSVNLIKVIIRLPGIYHQERSVKEIHYLHKINELIHGRIDSRRGTESVVQALMELVQADACGITYQTTFPEGTDTQTIANINIIKPALQLIDKQLRKYITPEENSLLIHDTTRDAKIDWSPFQQSWRSVIAVSITALGGQVYHLYVFKRIPYAYRSEDLRTARTFLMQLCMLRQQSSESPQELTAKASSSLIASGREKEKEQTSRAEEKSSYRLDCLQLNAANRVASLVERFSIPTGEEAIIFAQVRGGDKTSRAAFFNKVIGGLKALLKIESRSSEIVARLHEIYGRKHKQGCCLTGIYLFKIKNARLQIAGHDNWQLLHFLADRGDLNFYDSASGRKNYPLLKLKKHDIMICLNYIPERMAPELWEKTLFESRKQPMQSLKIQLEKYHQDLFSSLSETPPALLIMHID